MDRYTATRDLAARLIACRSITPSDGGCLDLIAARLEASGFRCERIDRGGVANLWARHGGGAPLVCLAGHVDVVPPGPLERWSGDPFEPQERDGYLYGRGATDMKASVAAMVTAVERMVAARPAHAGSVAVLLTADEEGDASDGTVAVVDTLIARGETIDACVIGEPTSVSRLGDTVKNGRRGSLNGLLTVHGVQCHIAYPERGRNPVHDALPALAEMATTVWDRGNEFFQPTGFQISNVQAGTGAPNVIPGICQVRFNVRFSPESTADGIMARVREILDRHGVRYDLEWQLSGAPFLTGRGPLLAAVARAVSEVTGLSPELSTGGGTSDGRFLARVARQVVEFGPPNGTMHGIDERVALADIEPLTTIYERIITMLLGD